MTEAVGVVGGGIMGAGIAEVAARRGCSVVLREIDEAACGATRERITKHAWSGVEEFQRVETLKLAPEAYLREVEAGTRTRSAAYELAIARSASTGRPVRKGERVAFYLAGRGRAFESAAVENGKGAFTHFMMKEIHDQPESVRGTLRGRIDRRFATARLDGLDLPARELSHFRRIKILGCGSACISGLLGARLIERLSRTPCDAESAAEFRYRNPVIENDTLYFVVSQSGETFDTLAVVEEIKRKGGTVAGVVNVVGSSIARACVRGIYLTRGVPGRPCRPKRSCRRWLRSCCSP